MPKRKSNCLDRQIKALGKLYRTKNGKKIIRENREGLLIALCYGVGKP